MEGDKLLTLPQIAEKLCMPEATVRYKRHLGELPWTFRMGRRVVGYESDADNYIRSHRDAQSGGGDAA